MGDGTRTWALVEVAPAGASSGLTICPSFALAETVFAMFERGLPGGRKRAAAG